MCARQRCKNRSPQYVRKRMVARNAVRRHVREQAAKQSSPQNVGKNTCTMFAGIQQQGRPPRSVANKIVDLDVTFVHTTEAAGRAQAPQKGAGKSVKICAATKRKQHAKGGTSGYTYATLAHAAHDPPGNCTGPANKCCQKYDLSTGVALETSPSAETCASRKGCL